MAHLTRFGVENFRVFEKETWFDFAPITILTGTNSCGKSNVVKAIVCFNELISSFKIPTTYLPQHFKYEYDFLTKYFGASSEIFNKSNDEKKFSFKIDSYDSKRADFTFISKNNEVLLDSFLLSNNNKTYFSVNGLYIDNFKTEYYFNFYNTNLEHIYSKLKNDDIVEKYNIKEFFKNKVKTVYSYKIKSDKFVSFKNWGKGLTHEMRQTFFDLKDYYYNSEFFNSITDSAKLKRIKELEEKALSNLSFSVQETRLNSVRFHFFSNDEKDNILDVHTALINNPLFFLMHLIRNKSTNQIKEIKFLNKETNDYFNFLIENDIFPILDLNNESAESSFMSLVYKSIIKDLDFIKARHGGLSGGIYINHFSKNQPKYYYVVSNTDNDFGKMIVDLFFKNSNKEALEFINKYVRIFELGEKFTYELKGDIVKLFIKKGRKTINIADLGAGVTQLITLIIKLSLHVDAFSAKDINVVSAKKVMTFEEPEINLHPTLQSKLADMFVDAARTFKIQFIIETHSEYLIRRLQYLTAKKEIKPEDTIIHYLFHPESEHTQKTGEQLRTIRIQEDGRLDKEFGTGFFDESTKLIEMIWDTRNMN